MIQNNQCVQFILYVADQKRSRDFYEKLLGYEPALDVPGMTEFLLNEGCKLGLMPESGIAKIFEDKAKHPALGSGIPRCEIYLLVDDPSKSHELALRLGATNVSDVAVRDWGHTAGYVKDFDGHIVAFAKAV
jgi:catechol 2,3-dioxygenase-like lactoylglutathione lyase family enzyme